MGFPINFSIGCFFPIRFPSYGMLHYMENAQGFLINFSQFGKMQQNPSYGVNLENWYLYFSCPTVWVIFPHTIPILWYTSSNGKWVSPSISHTTGKCNKTHRMGRTWATGAHTFPIVSALFFSLDSHFTVCFIKCEIHVFSH